MFYIQTLFLNSLGKDNTYGIATGKSGPRSLEPSQKQSKGVMIAQGIMFSKIWKNCKHSYTSASISRVVERWWGRRIWGTLYQAPNLRGRSKPKGRNKKSGPIKERKLEIKTHFILSWNFLG